MKKLFAFVAVMITAGFSASAMAHPTFTGTYTNDVGSVVINAPAQGTNNYTVKITDKSGKCDVSIQASTNVVTATGKNGGVYNINTLAAVESQTYPNFSLWPEDETIKLAPDSLDFSQLAPACQAFKDNMTFTRQQ